MPKPSPKKRQKKTAQSIYLDMYDYLRIFQKSEVFDLLNDDRLDERSKMALSVLHDFLYLVQGDILNSYNGERTNL